MKLKKEFSFNAYCYFNCSEIFFLIIHLKPFHFRYLFLFKLVQRLILKIFNKEKKILEIFVTVFLISLYKKIMFYEESQIREFLNCPKCSKRYDEPKILPCGKVICNTCINSYSGTPEFCCSFCRELHKIPNCGLPICELRMNLLLTTPEEVYRSLMFSILINERF